MVYPICPSLVVNLQILYTFTKYQITTTNVKNKQNIALHLITVVRLYGQMHVLVQTYEFLWRSDSPTLSSSGGPTPLPRVPLEVSLPYLVFLWRSVSPT